MFEQIILGTIQGVAEWLPVSSEGIIVLVKANFFPGLSVGESVRQALFLHFGTFFAALIYFWKDVVRLIRSLFRYTDAGAADRKLLKFLIITTLISGALGFILLRFAETLSVGSRIITLIVGVLLLVTAWLQLRIKSGGRRNETDLNQADNWILGLLQGLSALPGLSRSGLTVAGLLLRDIDEEQALRISFLMSLPIVLGGNIALNLNQFALSAEKLTGLIFAFIFGLLTIHLLLKLARKVNFGWFVLIFAIMVLVAALI